MTARKEPFGILHCSSAMLQFTLFITSGESWDRANPCLEGGSAGLADTAWKWSKTSMERGGGEQDPEPGPAAALPWGGSALCPHSITGQGLSEPRA